MSPLGFPKRIGPVFRVITAIAFLILSSFVLYSTVTEIQKGEMYLGSRYGQGSTFHQEQDPKGFWIATFVNFGMVGLFSYLSIRELMLVAAMKHKAEPGAAANP